MVVNNLEVKGHVFFNGRESIMIALGLDLITEKYKAYIRPVQGDSVEADIISTIEYGTKFPVLTAFGLIRDHGDFIGEDSEELYTKLVKKEL